MRLLKLLIIASSITITCFACSNSDTPLIPGPVFNQVATYNEIPSDFILTYDIRDEYASPPYRIAITINKSGSLIYELTESNNAGFNRVTETAAVSEDDVLAFYNYIISKGYFNMEPIYVICYPVVPVVMIETKAKLTTKRVQHQTCPSCKSSNTPPDQFWQIIDYLKQLADDYIDIP